MDQELYDKLVTIMVAADLPEDSSRELAFHVALHYPEHGAALIARHGAEADPMGESDS